MSMVFAVVHDEYGRRTSSVKNVSRSLINRGTYSVNNKRYKVLEDLCLSTYIVTISLPELRF